MARVRIVHWKVAEAAPLIEACRACGFDVEYDDVRFSALAKRIRETAPDAVVIDLTCLPGRGRDTALALRRTKYARHIPLVFVDGAPEKVEAIRRQLPDAVFAAGLTRYLVRQFANEAGLANYKICAVNEQWSGMALAHRKS
jgi:hypothetical protein